MATLPLSQPPLPAPRLNRLVVGGLFSAALLLLLGAFVLYASWTSAPTRPEVVEESPPPIEQRPTVLRDSARTYTVVPEPTPVAVAVVPATTPLQPAAESVNEASMIPSSFWGPTSPGALSTTAKPVASQPAVPPAATTPRSETPARKKWDFGVKGTPEAHATTLPPREELKPDAKALALIQPATWAIPAYPLLTLYRSSVLPGRLLNKINTDIPATTIRILITMPIFGGSEAMPDRWQATVPLIDKGAIVIAKQVGRAEFGQQRVPLHLEQIHLPSGAVVELEGQVGDKDGAVGVPGKVNAHLGQLLLATGINAVLNLGLNTAAGTPGANQYYQNPAQKAAQEAGESVARDVNEYSRQVLKRPPTIEVSKDDPKYNIVSIQLEKNLMFSRKPLVIK